MKKEIKSKKFALPRVLIIGCGDVGMRILPLLGAQLHLPTATRFKIFAATSQASRCAELRAAGAIPIIANLDQPASLARLANLADLIIYLAPPPTQGNTDSRSRHLAARLSHRCRLVYVSTSGVYGDCGGAMIAETRSVKPHNPRAVRRVDAEQVWRDWARRTGSILSILRVPGIYAGERLPIERLKKQTPALRPEDDVYTNHIHADDLARITLKALFHGRPNRIYHAVDDSCLMMGEYFDLVADTFGLARPARLARAALAEQVNPMLLSFMSESRRLSNRRMQQELGIRLQYPTVQAFLQSQAVSQT